MERQPGVIAGLALLLVVSGVSAASSAQAAEPSVVKPAAATALTQRPASEGHSRQVTGVISAVDREAKTVTIKARSGQQTFSLSPRVQVKLGKLKATLAELQPGKQVFIRYRDVDGKALATTIKVM